jgi:hypothetical protein
MRPGPLPEGEERRPRRWLGLGWAAVAGLLAGCAQVGPIQPPSAHLPHPVGDFAAVRRGPLIRLAWTPPTTTSDGVAWQGLIHYRLCVWPGVEAGRPSPPVRRSRAVPPDVASPPAAVAAFTTPAGRILPPCPRLLPLAAPQVTLAALALPASAHFATLALLASNADAQGTGWSNPVTVALTPVAPPPRNLAATPTADGVALHWQLPSPPPSGLRLYRNGVVLAALPGSAMQYLDGSAAWKRRIVYFLRSTAGTGAGAVESGSSAPAVVFTAPVAPPPPTGLQVVAAPAAGGVDLSWNPVAAGDMAGYIVYRRLPGAARWQRRNTTPLLTPVYHDSPAPPGTGFAVASVSTSGAVSARSAAARLRH